jgi:hypothetical protein
LQLLATGVLSHREELIKIREGTALSVRSLVNPGPMTGPVAWPRYNQTNKQITKCVSAGVWIGWWDVPTEGTFESVIEPYEPLNPNGFHPWSPGEPNGDTQESCVELKNYELWNDEGCSSLRCTACQMKETPLFEMRGLCVGSTFEANYGWTGEYSAGSEKYSFRFVSHLEEVIQCIELHMH